MDLIRYPIGKFKRVEDPSMEIIESWIAEIAKTPVLLKDCISDLDQSQLNKPYRPGGWTVRQVIHHVADNDINVYFRIKRILTEEQPLMPSFNQEKWAELSDYYEPVEFSLQLIDSIYHKLFVLLRNLGRQDYRRTLHSVTYGVMSLDTVVQRFLWHDRHHLAQILSLRNREGW